jgi:hypothetical protein
MASEFLKKVDAELKQKVRDKKQDAKDEIKTGLLSFMLENVSDKIVSGFTKALSSLKLPTPKVEVKPPVVNVTVPDIVIPEIKAPEVKIPQISVPEAKVTVELPDMPEIKIPEIKVPTPQVTVNVEKPDTPIIPPIEIPEVMMPDEMTVKGGDSPLPVKMVDDEGKPISFPSGGGNSSKIGKSSILNADGSKINPATEEKQNTLIANQTNNTQKVQITAQDSPSIDAFARWRVSNPETIFDSKQLWDSAPLFWDDSEVSGGSTTSVHSTDTASTVIGVALNTAGRRVRQTFMRFNYQPGKSQLIFATGTLDKLGGETGITRGWGYYDDDNGIFLKDNEGTVQFVIRSKATGSVVNDPVSQASWNLDTMDGNGASGIDLDFTKSQITIIDLEWLGVGRVRAGFVIAGIPIYVHEFNHSNVLSGVYMSTPNLPMRYEIENDGTGVASTLEHICCSVMSEGGLQKTGILRHFDSGAVSGLSAGTSYAILGIKLKSTHLDASVIIENISALATTQNDQAHWDLILNPTVAGTFTYADATNSALQTATGASTNTITNGIDIDGGYFSTVAPTSITTPNALRLGAKIDNTVDEIVIIVTPITNNITVHASMTIRELS